VKPLKILHVDPEVRFAGGERQVEGLIRHLAALGHENLLAAPPAGALASRIDPRHARIVPLAIRNDLDVLAALRLGRMIRRERPDVVHHHTARAHKTSLWLPREAPRSIVTRRMDYPIRPGRLSDVLYGRRVAAVVAISAEVRRMLVAAGVAEERIRSIPSGVDPPERPAGDEERRAAREALGADAEQIVVSILAALERRKGHDVLLRALAGDAVPPRVVCRIAGEGRERESLEGLARELGLAARVRFLGERRDVGEILAASDVAVLPSRAEGLGVAILEAMAHALPVVASRVGGIPEAVLEGETGLLVPPEDPDALGAALARLAGDAALRRRMGAAGRARVLAGFTLRRSAERYEALYREIARLPRTPA
jgi:glycosyltransferase involved in cell wall biosynthesis